MNPRSVAVYAFEIGLLLAVAAILVGQFYGTPVLLSFVETGSMAPTIEAGDGFVAVPTAVAGPVEEGDVVTFDARNLHGGGLTTHRVVGETDEGYVTQGDANAVTDQDDTEPHVSDGQIKAKALQIDGEVVAIPHLGTAVMGIQSGLERIQGGLAATFGTSAFLGAQGLSYLLFGFGILVYAIGLFEEHSGRPRDDRSRSRSRPHIYDGRRIVLLSILFMAVVSMGTMGAMSGTERIDIVSASFDSERPTVIPAGEQRQWNDTFYNGGVFPVVTTLEPTSNGIETGPPDHVLLPRGESANVTVTVTAPPETGSYIRSYREYRYFMVLPPSVILALHEVHPWLAMGAVTGVISALFVAPVLFVTGFGTVRTRERKRESPTGWW
ncbi:MAG: S26 family signal peptidase [Halobacteriota archaeon]|uniref:S26 family signal peptidase n=1 Tax=Natronomonas sp. TaxID=2184060 RepID=UPI003976DA11